MANALNTFENINNKIESMKTIVSKYPENKEIVENILGLGEGPISIRMILYLLRQCNVDDKKIIEEIVNFLTPKDKNSNGVLDAIEVAIKSSLWMNLKNMLTCSVNPFISDNLMYTYKDYYNNDRNGNGIKLNIGELDIYNMLSKNPYLAKDKDKGSYYYFDVKTPTTSWQSCDFNVFMWYLKNRAIYSGEQITNNIWDNRIHDYDGYGNKLMSNYEINERNSTPINIDEIESFRELFFNTQSPNVRQYGPFIDDIKTDELKKYQYFYCKYNERGVDGNSDDDTLRVWLNPKRYYNKYSMKIPTLRWKYKIKGNCKVQKIGIDKEDEILRGDTEANILYYTQSGNIINYIKCPEGFIDSGSQTIDDYNKYLEDNLPDNLKDKNFIDEFNFSGNTKFFNPDFNILYKYDRENLPSKDYKELKYNKTLFEFNYDYIYGIKLFDSQSLIANFINAIMNNLFDTSLNIGAENNMIREFVEQIVEQVVAEDEVEDSEDCYYTFNDEVYRELLKRYYEKKRNSDYGDDVISETNDLIENLNISDKEGTINTITRIAKMSGTLIQNNINNSADSVSLSFGVLTKIWKILLTELAMSLLTPKVMILYGINLATIGDPFAKENNINFENIWDNLRNLLVNVIRNVKNIIIQRLTQYLLKYVSQLAILYEIEMRIESIVYTRNLIKEAINCLKTIDNGNNNNNITHRIDNVDYADIIATAVDNENIVPETITRKKNC